MMRGTMRIARLVLVTSSLTYNWIIVSPQSQLDLDLD